MPPRLPARVADRHMIGKYRDPSRRLKVEILSAENPFRRGTLIHALFSQLCRTGLQRFFTAGGSRRYLNVFARHGLIEVTDT